MTNSQLTGTYYRRLLPDRARSINSRFSKAGGKDSSVRLHNFTLFCVCRLPLSLRMGFTSTKKNQDQKMTVDPTPTSPSLKVWAGDHCPRSPSDSSSDQKSVKTKSSSDCLTSASSSPRLEPVGRSSFCSVREHDTDLAQALTSSKVSSYSTIKHSDDQGHDATHITQNEAIDDESSSDGDSTEVVFHPPRTHSHSKLREHLYPANSHWRRKQIKFRGRTKSPSYCDLQMLNAQRDPPYSDIQREKETAPGESRLERLPYELLSRCCSHFPAGAPHRKRKIL